MHDINIHRLDLNLLKIFLLLLECRSVTVTADRMGLAQSSISHALSRLREALGDQLFVRSTTGMQPTPYALKLAASVQSAFDTLQSALQSPDGFDPALSTQVFDIVMTDVCELMFLPELMRRLGTIAPRTRISIHQMARSAYRGALEEGIVDLALGQLPEGHSDFFQRHLFEETFTCVMRPGHPLQNKLTLKTFMEAEHAAIGSPAVSEKLIRRALRNSASERQIRLELPHYTVVPFVVGQSDLLAVLPRTVSRAYARQGVVIEHELPFRMEPVETRQFWHKRTHSDPAWKWLRSVIADLFASKAKSGPACQADHDTSE